MRLELRPNAVAQRRDGIHVIVWDRAPGERGAMMKCNLRANRDDQHAPELRRRDPSVIGAFSVESAVLTDLLIGNIDSVCSSTAWLDRKSRTCDVFLIKTCARRQCSRNARAQVHWRRTVSLSRWKSWTNDRVRSRVALCRSARALRSRQSATVATARRGPRGAARRDARSAPPARPWLRMRRAKAEGLGSLPRANRAMASPAALG